jgi:hypothetical protein
VVRSVREGNLAHLLQFELKKEAVANLKVKAAMWRSCLEEQFRYADALLTTDVSGAVHHQQANDE